jgi:hypothetical protein
MQEANKPHYLGLLNSISLAERNAGFYLKAWADVTPDPDLKRALCLVAARETTHGEVFRQRIERLGFSLLDKEDAKVAERVRTLGDPGRSDVEKILVCRRDVVDAEPSLLRLDTNVGRIGGSSHARHAALVRTSATARTAALGYERVAGSPRRRPVGTTEP